MSETFAEELSDARRRGGIVVASLWARTVLRIPVLALEEHMRIGRRRLRWLLGRPARGVAWTAATGSWAQDVRIAVRGLARAPSFAAVTVLTIGVGAGATMTLFSLTNALLFRPLPVASPDRLVRVQEQRDGWVEEETVRRDSRCGRARLLARHHTRDWRAVRSDPRASGIASGARPRA